MTPDAKEGSSGESKPVNPLPENVEKRGGNFIDSIENNTSFELSNIEKAALILTYLGVKPATVCNIPVYFDEEQRQYGREVSTGHQLF